MNKKEERLLKKKEHDRFYQAKYENYRVLNKWIISTICISNIFFFLTDLVIQQQYSPATIVPRFIVLLPLIIFIAINESVKDYKIMSIFTYGILHIIMWCSVWSASKISDLSTQDASFFIILTAFLIGSHAAPHYYQIIAEALVFVDLIIANNFLHYPSFMVMIVSGIAVFIATCVYIWIMEQNYRKQYQIKGALEESAFHDQLTGMYNRNIMNKLVRPDNTFGEFYTGGLNIILMDIDFFKRVNDTYGHDKGDIVLKSVANIVSSKLSPNDKLIRWGGEEYIIFNPGGFKNALSLAESIRTAVEASDNGICHITVSLGVAMYEGGDYNKSVKHADEALYVAKESGRNRVISYADIADKTEE